MSNLRQSRGDGPRLQRPLSLLAAAALALPMVLADPADARKRKRNYSGDDRPKPTTAIAKSDLPLVLVISIPRQRVAVYAGTEKIAESPISSGQRGYETPAGVFTVIEKNKTHFSNLYDAAPMPFMQRITWSGVAMHAGVLPGYPASHGCIRLPYAFARELFGVTSLGARVVIARDETAPVDFAHDKMIVPLPSEKIDATAPPAAEPIEVASNEAADDLNPGFLENMARVAAATSPDASWPKPRTREEAAAIRAAKLARHEGAVISAEAAVPEAAARVKAAVEAVKDAYKAVEPARDEYAKLDRLARRAQGEKAELEDRLAELVRRAERRPTNRNKKALESKRPELEAKIKALAESGQGAAERAAADAAKAELDKRIEARKAAEAERIAANAGVKTAAATLKTVQDQLLTAKRVELRRNLPISIFVSRIGGKLYVRQGNDPIAEAPVVIDNPGKTIGTHVFTAIGNANDGKALRWTAVSVPTRLEVVKDAPRLKTGMTSAKMYPAVPAAAIAAQTASAALERVTFPAETQDLLAELIKPGSTVMISDYDVNKETGKGTDHILAMNHPDDPPFVWRPQRKPEAYSRRRVTRSYGYDDGGGYGYTPRRQYAKPRRYSPPPQFFYW